MNAQETTSVGLEDVLDVIDIAVATVSRRLPSFVSREDLASVGKLALVKCLAHCEGSLDEIRAQCYVRIRGAILDEVRKLDSVPRRQRDLIRSIARTTSDYETRNGRAPTHADLASALCVPEKLIQRALAAIAAAENTERVAWDSLPDENAVSPSIEAETTDAHAVLLEMLGSLTVGQAAAIRQFYLEDATLQEVGEKLGVSTERARQLRDRAVEKLRTRFAAH